MTYSLICTRYPSTVWHAECIDTVAGIVIGFGDGTTRSLARAAALAMARTHVTTFILPTHRKQAA